MVPHGIIEAGGKLTQLGRHRRKNMCTGPEDSSNSFGFGFNPKSALEDGTNIE
mgnify:CR=1 FL=1